MGKEWFWLMATAGGTALMLLPQTRDNHFILFFLAIVVATWATVKLRDSRMWQRLPWLLILVGFGLRLLALAGPPGPSDDIYRYVWDGRVSEAGYNPYRHPPNSPFLDHIPGSEDLRAKINHPEIRTVYPPVAQGLFVFAAGWSVNERGLRFVMVLLELVLLAALGFWSLASKRGHAGIRLWWLHPLPVLEISGAGHIEVLALLFLALAVAFWQRKKGLFSAVSFVMSVFSKWIPLAFFVLFLNKKWKSQLIFWGGFVFLSSILIYPMLKKPEVSLGGLDQYASRWIFADTGFYGTYKVLDGIGAERVGESILVSLADHKGLSKVPDSWWRYKDKLFLAKGLCALGLLVSLLLLRWKCADQATTLTLAGLLLMWWLPAVHPWYALWALMFCGWTKYWKEVSFFATLWTLTYASYHGEWAPVDWYSDTALRWPLLLGFLMLAVGIFKKAKANGLADPPIITEQAKVL